MARLGGIDTQYFDASGDPLAWGRLYCYETGTYTPKGTFHDSAYNVPNKWPIELDAIGVPPDVFFSGTARFVLTDSDDAVVRDMDPIIDNEFQTGDTVLYRLGDIGSQFFDQNGEILANGRLYVYENGTSTPKDTYSNNALSSLNAWPIVFDSVGFLGDVFFEGKARLVLTDQHGVQQRELDDVDTFDIDYLPGFITDCPPEDYVQEGQTVLFCVEVDGDPADYTYQWYQDLTLLTGETAQCLSFVMEAADDDTMIWVYVTKDGVTETCYTRIYLALTGCTEWDVISGTVTATDFWVSPDSPTLAAFDSLIEKDILVSVRGDEVYIQHLSNIVYTTDFGDTWTTESLVDWMPIDLVWDAGEKTSSSFTNCAFPAGVPSSDFSLQAWRYVGNNLICSFYNSDSDTGFIANVTANTILRTGFSDNALTETTALGSGYVGVPYLPADECRTFCFWDGELTTLGIVYERYPADPYSQRHALVKGDPIKANAVTLSEGSILAYRMEIVNDQLLWFGDWGGASGGGLADRYGHIHNDIAFGGIYTFDASWRQPVSYALSWWADSAPTFQPTKTEVLNTGGNYPNTLKQRAARWLDSEVMFAGVISKRYGYVYTNLTDSAQQDYSTIFNYGARDAFEVMPVPEKGAFISMEVSNNVTSTTIRISPTADPADFSTAVTLTLPVAKHTSYDNVAMFYSTTQEKFLMVYGDSNGKTHIIQFDDPFECITRE